MITAERTHRNAPAADGDAHPGRVDAALAHRFRPKGLLDWLFVVGLAIKGLDGVAELIGGVAALLVTPGQLQGWARMLTRGELSQDPTDPVATMIVHFAGGLTSSALLFGAIDLLVHGVVKVVLIAAVLLNKLWAYPWVLAALVAFIGYQLYKIATAPSAGMVALTVLDAVIVALTVREWRQQRRRQPQRSDGSR